MIGSAPIYFYISRARSRGCVIVTLYLLVAVNLNVIRMYNHSRANEWVLFFIKKKKCTLLVKL